MKKRYHIIVHGKVQGVMFRHNTAKIANKANVFGWVRNNSDGTVETVLEGDEENVERVVNWCKKGTIGSKVDRVEITEEDFKDEFGSFSIVI